MKRRSMSIRRLKAQRKKNAIALDEFLVQQTNHWRSHSLWFDLPHLEVYLRAGPYSYDEETGCRLNTVGVASVTVHTKKRGRGHFSRFMRDLERRAVALGYDRVQGEQVLSDQLKESFPRWGYSRKEDGFSPSFYISCEELKARAHGCTGGNHE